MTQRRTWGGKTALITGASMGLGAAFADALASQGCHLVLVARSRDKLEALAAAVRSRHAVRAEVIVVDLTTRGAVAQVREELTRRGLAVDLLVNNAGLGAHGRFEELAAARQLQQVALNISALVELTHAFLPELLERSGAILNVASLAAFQPTPATAVYGASKAFVLSFSEALFAELEGRGVRVLALCPGAIDTPFFEVAGQGAAAGTTKARPEDVVKAGLEALARGGSYVVPGLGNYLVAQVSRALPRASTARLTARVTMKGLAPPRLSAANTK